MTLYLIGLGLGDEKDITIKGFDIVKAADKIFLEHYTSILGVDKEKLESFYGKTIELADRDLVEKEIENKIILPAKEKDIALLIVGDPFGATTHTDIILRAKELEVPTQIVHNASIMNAVGVVGLELYKYGKTTSIPFWDDGFEPETPYDVIRMNQKNGLHTLCLLDIKVKEPTKEELRRGKTLSKPKPRFMTVEQGLEVLQQIEERRKENVISQDTLVIGVARIGQKDQKIIAGTLKEIKSVDFGTPLHSLIIPGSLHTIEEEMVDMLREYDEPRQKQDFHE